MKREKSPHFYKHTRTKLLQKLTNEHKWEAKANGRVRRLASLQVFSPARSMVLPLGRGREPPGGPRAALRRLRGVYSPTHYYVRVSQAETFTGRSLASCRPTKTSPCATPDHRWGDQKPGQDQGARGTLAASSVTAGPPPGRRARQHLPRQGTYLQAGPCSMQREEGPAAGIPPHCSQCPSCSCGGSVVLRVLVAAAPWFTCDRWSA